MTGPTPPPYLFVEGNGIDLDAMAEAFGLGVARVVWTEEHGDLAYVPLAGNPDLADRNARFITTACNLHAALVAAIQDGRPEAIERARLLIEEAGR
ncbi:MAG: hypothetical protein SYC29_12495 [Planctomycetota bacterium]|nr:hypothetical protein [Planctomycetota bacterium]